VTADGKLRLFRRLARFGTVLALGVVVLGAYVRLTAAGLGCPDWPGCYGHFHPAQVGGHFDYGKALREMEHRYLATSLGLIIIALCASSIVNRRDRRQPRALPIILLLLVCVQGALGALTVVSRSVH
jgi:cytochrome c oxidase assembly protein subunit 15